MKSRKKIKILGVGDYGIGMVEEISKDHTDNIEYFNLNTDWAFLNEYKNPSIKLGPKTARGFGAAGYIVAGKMAAEESRKDIIESIKDAGLVIIVAGLGGGTGSGASPVVASISKELNIPVFAFVTTPFEFEGKIRCKNSEESIKELKGIVDLLIITPLNKRSDIKKERDGIT